MFDNLPDLMRNYPIGMRIKIDNKKRNDYVEGKFIVEGYIYEASTGMWYPAHKMFSGEWEVFKD